MKSGEGVASPYAMAISGRSTCQMFSGARNWKIIFYHACLLESQWSISDDDDWCNALGKNNSADGLLQSGVRNHHHASKRSFCAQAPKNNALSVAQQPPTRRIRTKAVRILGRPSWCMLCAARPINHYENNRTAINWILRKRDCLFKLLALMGEVDFW